MKSIILAAGEGKRLNPLTTNTPKCMVELFGKSLLLRQIETFRKCNILDISVVTGYRSELINYPNITYFRNTNFDKTNMIESLFCAKEKLTDCVIVSYGDIVFEKKILEKLSKAKDDVSVVIDENWKKYWSLRFENPLTDAESLIVDGDGYIQNIGQKVQKIDEICGQYIGLMKFQNDGINTLREFYEKAKLQAQQKGINILNKNLPFEESFMTDLLQALINANCQIKAIPTKSGWLELDSIKDFEIYQKMYEDKTLIELIDLEN